MKRQMNIENIQQKFEGSVVMYDKRPVLFNKIAGDFSCRIFDLMDQEEKQVEFLEDKFHPPVPRIGMVNVSGSVVYVQRNPVRRYKLGLSKENLEVLQLPVQYPEGGHNAIVEIAGLKSKALGNALLVKYPTKMQCFRRLSQFPGAVAFDKQFAVCSEGYLWYKTKKVGTHDGRNISFNDAFKHLEILVDKGYEKNRRIV